MKKLIIFLLLIFRVSISAQTATIPSGSGTSGDPYIIESINNLYWMADQISQHLDNGEYFVGKYFKQVNNIDASITSIWFSGAGFLPIGFYDEVSMNYEDFGGTYDGQGYTVSNIYINRPTETSIGFFGSVTNGTVKNLGVTNLTINAKNTAGGLIGYMYGACTIENCFTTGTITTTDMTAGGIAGMNDGDNIIRQCHSDCDVTGATFVAGLFGQGNGTNAETSDCYATGLITSTGTDALTAGLIAYAYGTITNCYATGDVSNSTGYSAGLINHNYGNVYNSYATGSVTGKSFTAGLIGSNGSGKIISNCYSTGTVNANDATGNCIGGLVGNNQGTISYSYTISPINSNVTPNKGAFVGQNYTSDAVINNTCFWNTEVYAAGLGQNVLGATFSAIGKTNIQMKTQSTFTDAGWDFTAPIWKINASLNNSYPYLAWAESVDLALPVELTLFSAIIKNNIITLNWQTATEVNNYGFEVQRLNPPLLFPSKEGTEEWVEVGFVKGAGNSNSPKSYSYEDKNPLAGKIQYRLKQIDNDGKYKYSNIVEAEFNKPAEFRLAQNYPNPFNPTTKIEFAIPTHNNVQIKVYNVLGMEVATLLNEHRQAGTHSIEFNAGNLASGTYFYKIVSGSYSEIKKMILLR